MNNPAILEKAKIICLIIGILYFLLGIFVDGAMNRQIAASMGCLMGIVSRIFQAEQHHLS